MPAQGIHQPCNSLIDFIGGSLHIPKICTDLARRDPSRRCSTRYTWERWVSLGRLLDLLLGPAYSPGFAVRFVPALGEGPVQRPEQPLGIEAESTRAEFKRLPAQCQRL
jgi:hypothetical protein